MAENSKIEWCHHTFNAWEGCEKVSAGCANCYAERRDKQYHGGGHWGSNGARKMMSEAYWKQPLKWNREAECNCGAAGRGGQECAFCAGGCVRPRVFCSSLADVFEDRPELEAPRRRLFKLIQATPNLDWLLLTKRPENIYRLTCMAIDPFDSPGCEFNIAGEPNGLDVADFGDLYPNIWLGTSVENQEQADRRIPELLKIPAKVRFLSCEPLLEPVDLVNLTQKMEFGEHCYNALACDVDAADDGEFEGRCVDWVIVGGESGPNARPMHPDWVQSLRNQCQGAGVPFHFKQWGEYFPVDQWEFAPELILTEEQSNSVFAKIGKHAAGRILDGRTWDEFPNGGARP